MRTFVIGDIHGAYRALKQVLERSNFDYEKDKLITLGDVVDGWSESYECVEELLKIKNRIDICGNHDVAFYEFMVTGIHPYEWKHGGIETAKSYGKNILKDKFQYVISYDASLKSEVYTTSLISTDIPMSHLRFFNEQLKFHKDDQKRLFVHGGFNRHLSLSDQYYSNIFWSDRDLWLGAMGSEGVKVNYSTAEYFSHIFIGHTNTMLWNVSKPITINNITNMDTGTAFDGKLSMMNIDSGEVFQSDVVQELYPDERGRNKI